MERMVLGNELSRVYDAGFYNIGPRPSDEDVSLDDRGTAPNGAPLSFSKLGQAFLSAVERTRICSVATVPSSCELQIASIQSLYNSGTLTSPTSNTNLAQVPFVLTIGCGAGIRGVNAIKRNKNGQNKCLPLQPGERVAVRGSFKTPGLRIAHHDERLRHHE